ncbi:MAG: type III-B CRISPR-associated protein Cas10/Cmr2 [Spirulinaceae cyanobacterium]
MSNADFWQRKINALLHDPPDKAFDIPGHEQCVQELASILQIPLIKSDYKTADHLASAADRLNFPENIKAKFTRLTHPLAGVTLNLAKGKLFPKILDKNLSKNAINQSLENLDKEIKQNPQKLFLWLWRNWSAQIQETPGNQLGVLWDLLPADTRIPDHSIWVHQALTSAIAGTKPTAKELPNPAFLLFSIGPVQAFISAARKTQDLWAGSYLLSYLNWAAMEVIAEEIGPDAVIFPNLLGQPLCDRWLKNTHKITPVNSSLNLAKLTLPSIPNRFLAIVPAKRGKELAQEAAEKMRFQWREIATKVREDLELKQVLNGKNKPNWTKTWERQIENALTTYWQIYPWQLNNKPIKGKDYHNFLNPHKVYLSNRYEKTKRILDTYVETGKFVPNLGAIYGDLYFITEKALGSRKGVRDFPQVEETGEKSTLGGDRAALYDGIDNQGDLAGNFDNVSRKQIRKFWRELGQNLQKQGRYELEKTGKERLDAVELTKRCAWRSYFDKQPGFASTNSDKSFRFPSTNSIASASFKKAVLECLAKAECDSLWQELKEWVEVVYPLSKGNRSDKNSFPHLANLVAKITAFPDIINKFLSLDGRLLFTETYEPQHFDEWHDADEEKIKEAKKPLQDFLKACTQKDIAKPQKYFAVLMMDGDEMGKWLAGDKMPEYEKVLHPDVKKQLEAQGGWQKILERQRLITPAIHGFISKALGDFSLKLVRRIVENRYPGKLVYAGGDDVLALVPLDFVLEVARELRAAFSGEIDTGIGTEDAGEKFTVKFGDASTRSGYLMFKAEEDHQVQLLTTMGCKATASTGIAIAHRLAPLDLTLQEARKAEKTAKNEEGRNAFSITFLKRSGEVTEAGAKWIYDNTDTIATLHKFQQHFANGSISGKFAYILRQEAEVLASIKIPALYQAEIKRLLRRQQGSQDEKLGQELTQELANLVTCADAEKQPSSPGKLQTFADLLIFTHFLATGEGEE